MAADLGAWLVFEDESGQGLRPPKGRTWGRRGCTPVVRVTAANSPRLSLAALLATRPGHRPRLIYRTHTARRSSGRREGRRGGRRKGLTEADYAALAQRHLVHADIARHFYDRPTALDHEGHRLGLVLLSEATSSRSHDPYPSHEGQLHGLSGEPGTVQSERPASAMAQSKSTTRSETVAVPVDAAVEGGDATARLLAEHGATVAVVARRTDRLDTLVSQIEADGGTALAVAADLTD